MKKARDGNFEILLKLVRLDTNVLYDKKTSKMWQMWENNRNSYHYKQIIKALNGLTKTDIKRKNTKIRIAAFIREVSEYYNLKLSYSDIYDLFDSIAKEQTGVADSDIPDDKGAFKKAVQREITERPFFSSRDKNKF